MAKATINTGIKGLDSDLQILFEATSGGRLQEINAAIANPNLTEDELFAVVPPAILRTVLGLRLPSSYKALMNSVPKEAHAYLEKAREVVEKLADVLKHPSILRRFTLPGGAEESSPLVNSLNIITSLDHFPCWTGTPPKMRPASRVAFVGTDNEVLLDALCDWDDLLFLVRSITNILLCEMENGRALAELELVDIPDCGKMAQRLQEIGKNLEQIKKIGRIYGLEAGKSGSPELPSEGN